MLKITVELWPYGSEEAKRTIAEGVIYNDGTGDYEIGNYNASLALFGRDSDQFQSRVQNFPRQCNVWDLLEMVLRGKKKKEIEERVKFAIHSLRSE